MFLDGRPPVNVGVTSGGDVFGGIGGHVQRRARRPAVQPLRGVDLAVPHAVVLVPEPRAPLQLRAPGLLADAVLLRQARERLLRPGVLRHHRSRPRRSPRARFAAARRSASGRSTATAASSCSAACCSTTRSSTIRGCRTTRRSTSRTSSAGRCCRSGTYVPLGVNFVQETTVFREFGPLAGQHHARCRTKWRRRSATRCRGRRPTSTRATTCGSARPGLLALRARGFKSWGDAPDFMYFGGNSEMRGYEYLEFVGDHVGVPQRRAALPVHRGDADADRHARRHPRRVLRQHGRRPLRGPARSSGCPRQLRALHADHRLPATTSFTQQDADLRRADESSTASASSTRAPPTASASRRSRSASPSTSTGRGRRCSTRTGKTLLFAAVRRQRRSSASRSSRSGSATTSRSQIGSW